MPIKSWFNNFKITKIYTILIKDYYYSIYQNKSKNKLYKFLFYKYIMI